MSNVAWQAEYPYRSHWLRRGAWRMHYLDEGQGETPLLMVHGNPTWSFYWRSLVDAFSPQYRCVVPDHVGCGLSDKPVDYDYTLQTHIDNLVTLIDELKLQQMTICGHDWGGAIALGAALARPDRVARIVLFNTGAFPPPFIPWRIRVCRTPLLGRLALQGLNLFSLAAMQMAVEDSRRLTPHARSGLLAPYDSWQHRIAVYRFVQDIPATPHHRTWSTLEQIEQRLPTLANRPVLMIWGMRDWCFTPDCLERLRKLFPKAEVERFDDVGHWVVEEASQRSIDRLRPFLASPADS